MGRNLDETAAPVPGTTTASGMMPRHHEHLPSWDRVRRLGDRRHPFADLGNEVVCVDNLPDKIAALEAGRMPIYEPGLEEMVARSVTDGGWPSPPDLAADGPPLVIVFITVGTPPR